MAVIGSLIKGALGGYGKKPSVPEYKPVDPTQEQQKTIAGNLSAMPEAQKLAGGVNKFNLEQLQQMLAGLMPGYGNIQNQISTNIQSQLKGEIPADVQAQVQNSAAAKAIGGGFGGTGMHGNLVARDFGMTSYGITQQAMDSATRWTQATAGMAQPMMMDVSSMFFTPQQRMAYAFQNNENKFNRDWMANQIKASPDPFRAALGDAFIEDEQQIMQMAGSMVSMAAGMCWVAREVYDGDEVMWRLFRHWLLNKAPKWFRNLYRKYGERFAGWLKGKDKLKAIIRRWMDKKVEEAFYGIIQHA